MWRAWVWLYIEYGNSLLNPKSQCYLWELIWWRKGSMLENESKMPIWCDILQQEKKFDWQLFYVRISKMVISALFICLSAHLGCRVYKVRVAGHVGKRFLTKPNLVESVGDMELAWTALPFLSPMKNTSIQHQIQISTLMLTQLPNQSCGEWVVQQNVFIPTKAPTAGIDTRGRVG